MPAEREDAVHRAQGMLQRYGHLAVPIPDALLALTFLLVGILHVIPRERLPELGTRLLDGGVGNELIFALFIEGGFLFMQAVLIDVATRLRARPPWWSLPIIAVALVMFTGGVEMLRTAAARGGAVLMPLVFSLIERFAVLWHMPKRTRTEKIAARALVSNRINTAALSMILVIACSVASSYFRDTLGRLDAAAMFFAGAFYFAVAACDAIRVRTPRFAANPSVLFRFDPIRIEHLHAV